MLAPAVDSQRSAQTQKQTWVVLTNTSTRACEERIIVLVVYIASLKTNKQNHCGYKMFCAFKVYIAEVYIASNNYLNLVYIALTTLRFYQGPPVF